MTVSTLRPNASTSNTGTVTGGATVHGALSDNSDSTYVTFAEDEGCEVTLGDFTLPADAILKSVGWRLRCDREIQTQTLSSNLISGTYLMIGNKQVSWTTPTTITMQSGQTEYILSVGSSAGVSITEALIDATSLSITNQGVFGGVNVYEAYVDVTYVTQPVTTAIQPTGTITTDSTPDTTFSVTSDSSGGTPTHFEVKVGDSGFDPDADVALAESGVVAGGFVPYGSVWINAWAHSTALPDGAYETHVRAAQTVGGEQLWSDWDFMAFTIAVDVPATPLIVITPESAAARNLIEIADPGGGDVSTDYFEIQASYDGGATWQGIRTPAGYSLIAPGIDAWDWEAPNGIEATYRARALHSFGDTVSASAWASNTATWSSDSVWIKHPTTPDRNIEL